MPIPGDQLHPNEILKSPEDWVNFIKNEGGAFMSAQTKNEWQINGERIPGTGIDNRFFGYVNITKRNLYNSQVIGIDTLQYSYIPQQKIRDFLSIGPLTNIGSRADSKFHNMEEVVEHSTYSREKAYVARFMFFGPSVVTPSRGSNALSCFLIIPEFAAKELIEQIERFPELPLEIVNKLYDGITIPEIKYQTTGLLLFSDITDKLHQEEVNPQPKEYFYRTR